MSASVDIEQIVRDVLARLHSGAAPQQVSPRATTNRELPQPMGAPKTRRHEARVLTAADVQSWEGIERVEVAANAVVTPSAVDLLRQRGIAVARLPRGTSTQNAGLPLVLGLAETGWSAAALVQMLRQRGASVQQLAQTGLATVVRETSAAVALGGAGGLLLTGKPAAAACLANRTPGVRAAIAENGAQPLRGVLEIGANVLALDPAGWAQFALGRLVEEFWRGLPRQAPPEFAG